MLKKFFLNTLSSFVGAWLALVLVVVSSMILLFGMIGSGIASEMGDAEQLKSKSILTIDLSGAISERESATAPDLTSLVKGNLSKPQNLNVIVEALAEAARNRDITAVYLKCGVLEASPAACYTIRRAVLKYKESKKPVYAYADTYTMGTYLIASAADRVYMNPQGMMEMQGMSSTVLYYKDLLDKLGVEFQVVKVGTFKSAVEPYIMNSMSDPARAQMDTLLGNMWGVIKKNISETRKGVTPQEIDSLVSKAYITFAPAKTSVEAGLVDSLVYERTINAKFAALTGQDVEDVNFVSPGTLVKQIPWSTAYGSKNRIAVLYAVGEINDVSQDGINYHNLVPIITELADDDNVKGMVLRVNSPGGSAFGSDQIGEALDYFQSKGKPLAVSMGAYAASGGYWISAGADKIFANPLTITGSIGIFGLIPNVKGLADKLGVNPQTVSTNPNAQFPSLTESMTDEMKGVMQQYVNRGYEDFVGRVAKGRKMSVPAVKRIAEGRVWDAVSAKRIGLVDSIGSLNDAIEWVASKAKILDKYNVAAYPEYKPSFWDMLPSNLSSMTAMRRMLEPKPEEMMIMKMRELLRRERIQARMADIKVEFTGK
jgi:signal peptide peptidase sppA, 67K type